MCNAKAEVAEGEISVTRWLSRSGRLSSTVVNWTAPKRALSEFEVWGWWQANPPKTIDFNHGSAVVRLRLIGTEQKRSRRGRVLELGVSMRDGSEGPARFSGKIWFRDEIRLAANWAAAAAMAREPGDLILTLRDGKGSVIRQHVVPKSLFDGFIPKADELLSETASMAADYKARCSPFGASDIVVN
jgi:hypothetical protein